MRTAVLSPAYCVGAFVLQEFSANTRRLLVWTGCLFVLMHYLSCCLWLTIRAQGFPEGVLARAC